MISADALIHAVQLRMQAMRRWRRAPGEFPAGWQLWFDSMRERVGAVTGASAEALIEVFLQRPLRLPPKRRAEDLTRWQAFTTLWHQEWHAQESDDERRWHWLAAGVSGGWHLFLAALLAWLMYLDLISVAHPPPKGEELVVQIEYVGEGTPEEVGGGPAAEASEQPQPERPRPAQPPAPAMAGAPASPSLPDVAVLPSTVQPPALQAPPNEVIEREIPSPAPVDTDQPLMVSEPVPDRTDVFVLPPPTPRIEMPVRVEIVDIPPIPTPSVQRPVRPRIELPAPQPELSAVIEREVPRPPLAEVPVIRPPESAAPELEAQAPTLRVREIPLSPAPIATAPAPAPAERQPTERQPTERQAAERQAAERPAADSRPAEPRSAEPIARSAGPEKTPASGGWPSPERADDWGAAGRERPGAQQGEPPGLYDSDGSVRLAETPGSASPGLPPGTVTEEIADLDRVGTWLRRPPNDYEPTAFNQYWRPDESLLAEWVRRSITTVRIPIPGTSKYIECTTVMLVMGGACGIGDPNLNEQPASARPPPDVPFKPELQEGNGSVPPPSS